MSDVAAKQCSRCGYTKPHTDFYRNRTNSDGRQRFCKPCQIENNRRLRLVDPEAHRARHHLYQERHAERERARRTAWREANLEKHRAHKAVSNALLSGRLVRPDRCERCDSDRFKIHGHHEDYAAQLDVEWLCASCHGELHATRKAAA